MARFMLSKQAQVKNNRLSISVYDIPEDGEVEVIIVKHDKPTHKQYKYYRGVLLPIFSAYLSDISGELVSDETAHIELQNKFIPYHNTSTSALSKEQMRTFIQHVSEYIASLGISVPPQESGITYAGTGEVFNNETLSFG
jgi:hypothetical protein